MEENNMDTAFKCYIRQRGMRRTSDVVEDSVQRRKELATLRLARIQNGAHPEYQKTNKCHTCKGGHPPGCCAKDGHGG